jgi:hypothetical protein
VSDEVPAQISAAIHSANLPKRFLGRRFQASEPTVLEVFGRRLVRFGRVMRSGSMCIDVDTGEVVDVEGPNVWHTNSSMEGFVRCLEAVLSEFPFYSEADDWGVFEAVAARLETRLVATDATCMEVNGFWETFRWDVANGDFPTEDLRTERRADQMMAGGVAPRARVAWGRPPCANDP